MGEPLHSDVQGGPFFRDLDGDGRPEWIFDDYDWYEHHAAGPRHLLVYRVDARKRLVLWKKLPNPLRIPLRHGIDPGYL